MKDQLDFKKSIVSIVGVIIIVVLCALGMQYLEKNKNKAATIEVEPLIPSVEYVKAGYSDYPVVIKSNGIVQAAKNIQLTAEVSGKLVTVSEKLKVGNIFETGAFIAQVDRADYRSALANQEALIAEAKLMIAQENARAALGIKEWQKLGKGEPTPLVARLPQLESAEARLLSAEAALQSAKRELERTRITAPFRMQIESKFVENGSFVSPGTRLLSARSASNHEVVLQLPLESYFLFEDKNATIRLTAEMGNKKLSWNAKYARDQGAVDQNTLSLPVILTVEENKKQKDFSLPPVGLYVKALLPATVMKQKVVIGRDQLRLGDKVLLVDEEDKLRIREVNVLFTDENNAVIEGVEPGEMIINSPMEMPVDGMLVKRSDQEIVHPKIEEK